MRTRVFTAVIIMCLAVGFGWYVAAQDGSSNGVEAFIPGQVLTAEQLNNSFGALLGALTSATPSSIAQVNCNAGETIEQALQTALPGTTIQVTGTCNETITITTNRLTLDGQGTAVLNGGGGGEAGLTFSGVITIDGAQGVTITGITVTNGAADGITGRRGAAFTVRDTVAENNADDGIQVGEFATAELINCTTQHNGGHGIVVTFNSSALFRGANESSNNTRHGIFVFGSSFAHFIEGNIQANNNGDTGILIATGASAFTSAEITTNGNVRFGMTLAIGGSLQTSGGSISAANNNINGLQVGNGATLTIFPGTTVTLENNAGAGLNIVGSSRALSLPGSTLAIEGNNVGVSVNDSSAALNGATIMDNGTDATLVFGARVTLSSSSIGTLTCDGTELIQGAICP